MFETVERIQGNKTPLLATEEKLKQIHWLVFNAAANLEEAKMLVGVTDEEYNLLMNTEADD